MSSCFGFRKSKSDDTQPLLPQYRDDTILQRELHQKLHSYQMIRALADGYMPSNEQLVVNLRSLLSSDVLNPTDPNLSDSGRRLAKFTKQWLKDFIELLVHKNSEDQIQDFIWSLTQSRVHVDVEDLAQRAYKAQSKAKTAAAYQSLQTVGSLLLTNSDFRIFLSDLNTVGREIFKDAAFSLSNVAEEAGKKIEPSQQEQAKLTRPGADSGPPPSGKDLGNDIADVSKVVANGVAQVAQDTEQSAEEKLSGDEGQVMVNRLKQAVMQLRKRPDYNQSVSTLSTLLKRYAVAYSRSVEETVNALEEDVHENAEMDKAGKNFWSLLSSFGDREAWKKLEEAFKKV
ncbi:hypothetical protein KCU98_g20094, partial [Aureobasidium melanogenum]